MMWSSEFSSLSVARMSLNDPLTRLYNREGFVCAAGALLDGEVRRNRWACLLSLQVNHLDVAGQRVGSEAADQFLMLTARCLREVFSHSAVIGRSFLSRFAVLWVAERREACPQTLDRLVTTIDRHNSRRRETDLSLSGGFIQFRADFPVSIDDLLGDADRQLQQAVQVSAGTPAP